jgi:hypothetical protein
MDEHTRCEGCGETPCEHNSYMTTTAHGQDGGSLMFRYCLCVGCDMVSIDEGKTWQHYREHRLRREG